MTKALIVDHRAILVKDDETIQPLDYISNNIDWVYMAPEDMEVVYMQNEIPVKIDVKKNDIIIQFYDRSFCSKDWNNVVVIDNEQWKTNVLSYNAYNENTTKNECCDSNESCAPTCLKTSC